MDLKKSATGYENYQFNATDDKTYYDFSVFTERQNLGQKERQTRKLRKQGLDGLFFRPMPKTSTQSQMLTISSLKTLTRALAPSKTEAKAQSVRLRTATTSLRHLSNFLKLTKRLKKAIRKMRLCFGLLTVGLQSLSMRSLSFRLACVAFIS